MYRDRYDEDTDKYEKDKNASIRQNLANVQKKISFVVWRSI